jgi:hypothetical protein
MIGARFLLRRILKDNVWIQTAVFELERFHLIDLISLIYPSAETVIQD